ncbi:O-antigen ligase family protein [Rhodococcoides kyotonense]|uniref:O-antigen ligase family protein n=1 Tax=Rhodococcoides kyotonense TaxID=398843 RepID=UPI001595D884|nr:O-antigen ligase family protein [Rhodococcus kyotonensis]
MHTEPKGDRLTARERIVWIAVASASLPSIFETEWKLEIPLGSVYLADLLLIVAILQSLAHVRRTPGSAVFYYCAVFAITVGAISEATIPWIVRDSRPFFYMIAGLVIGAFAVQNPRSIRFGVRCLVFVVVATTVLAVISQFSEMNVVGTERGATNAIYYNGEARNLSAKRIQTEPVPLALFLLCCSVAAWVMKFDLSGFLGKTWFRIGLLSAVILTVVAYSRNSVVGLAAAIFLAAIIPAALSRAERLMRLLVLIAAAAVFVGIPIWIGYQFGYFGNVIDSFSARVIAGIAPDVIGTDPSVGWRFTEMNAAAQFVLQHPIGGSGFGGYYRDRVAGEPFRGDQGRLYLHNYYMLLFVKFGVLAGSAVLTAIIASVVRLIRSGSTGLGASNAWSVLACGFFALLVVSSVAPVMFSRSFAVLGGVIVGVGLLSTGVQRRYEAVCKL